MIADPVAVPDRIARAGAAHAGRRLRVLQVIDSLTLGGAEQLLVTLARNIDQARYDLRVCSLAPIDEGSPVVRDLRGLGTPLYALTRTGERRHSPWHVARLAGMAHNLGINVLHTHLGYGNTIGALAGALARRPVVSTLHNAHFDTGWSGRLRQQVRSQALRWYAHTIIACAPEVREAGLTRLRLPARKLVDVPNGIETAVYSAADAAEVASCRRALLGEAGGPLVIAVGNLRAAKGHEYLLEAMPRVLARFPGLRVVIVGRGGEYQSALEARAGSLGVRDKVILTGQRRDVARLLRAADLFVQPSIFEGLPLALLEAMAAGTPVVATAVGGVPRVVENGVTGRLIQPADDEALATAMLEVLTDSASAAKLAAAAQELVTDTYGARTWAQRLEYIYSAAATCAA